MALKSTIFKIELSVADMNQHYYADHNLTLAKHPSETDERMMIRVLAYALNAGPTLAFTKGISTDDEPDIWKKSLSGEIETWIDLGQPDIKRIRQACGRSRHVIIYCYSGHSAELWWQQNSSQLERFNNLNVYNISEDITGQIKILVQRTMHLTCNIQDDQIWISDDSNTIEASLPTQWK